MSCAMCGRLSLGLLALAVTTLLLSGCGNTKRENTLAALPDLPESYLTNLKPVPNRRLLATSQFQGHLTSAAVQGPPPPPCTRDETIDYYSAEVHYPITTCVMPGDLGAFPPVDQGPTGFGGFFPQFKLENERLPRGLRADESGKSQVAAGTKRFFWFCSTNYGPWQGELTVERNCVGNCSPGNDLTLTDTPNPVSFLWLGAISQHPNVFQFEGQPTLQDHEDLGQCSRL